MKTRRPAATRSKNPVFAPENVHSRWTTAKLNMLGDEVEQHHFISGDFAGASLNRRRFTDCVFERCNLSLAILAGTALQNVRFVGCKLTGVQFAACRDFLLEVQFEDCQLNFASFLGKPLRGTPFVRCDLQEADFTAANLSDARFPDCLLDGATFQQTQLSGADLRTASGFHLDPEQNTLTGAWLTLEGLPGLLGKYGLRIE